MKLLLFLAAIGGLCFYVYSTATSGKGVFSSTVGTGMEKAMSDPGSFIRMGREKQHAPVAVPDSFGHQSPGIPVPAPGAPAPASGAPLVAPVPVVEKPIGATYRFRHRQPPLDAEMQELIKLGVSVSLDRSTGQAVLRGPVTDVDIAMRHLEAIDLGAASCGVRIWAVYVDRTVGKGWDLTAAISAVTDLDPQLVVGGGGVALDLEVGKLTAALDIIADGGAVEVIQRPHVTLTQGSPALVESLQEVPIPSVAVSQGISQSSVLYRKVGLELEITPYFLASNRVALAVNQSNGLIGSSVQVGGSSVPIIESQRVKTSVELEIGQSVILGGVATDRLRTVRGLLRNTQEKQSGFLYVVLSTFAASPSSQSVRTPPLLRPASLPEVPLADPMESPADWIDGELLPEKPWLQEEADFIRSKSKEVLPVLPAPGESVRKPRFARKK